MIDFMTCREMLKSKEFYTFLGKVDRVVGLTIESTGPRARIGDVCKIYGSKKDSRVYLAEVIGFKADRVLLVPYEDMNGVGFNYFVENTRQKLEIPVSDDLIGRVISPLGKSMDEKGELVAETRYSVEATNQNPLMRSRIKEVLHFGIKAIDGMLTIGKGQRVGIFSGSGVGKSTLLGMIARNAKSDVNVIALVGERGREVREFIEKDLGKEGMERSILVVATSDQPAMMRVKCALTASAVAEYFKDQGRDVLLMMDSLTRFAMAQREVGLSAGEPPVARGYTPSIYAAMPKLLERAGSFEKGSITALYTVLVEGDDTNEPISDTVRGIVDGHIILSRDIASRNHYPSIDILSSISRLMNDIVVPEEKELAGRIREIMALYYANYDLITIGAYKPGINGKLDGAVSRIERVNAFLRQGVEESFSREEVVNMMREVLA
ncbi:MAG: flagellar protein export ATPase FliI [Oscillospiraceae bacterium]|jgi:flagellum-specific ATP synthase|nr:flagellar protein export ATPase FliI [Oscillospiraceae bacterium]